MSLRLMKVLFDVVGGFALSPKLRNEVWLKVSTGTISKNMSRYVKVKFFNIKTMNCKFY